MFPPFSTCKANKICLQIKEQLDNGILFLEQITKVSQERADNGIMIGVLICKTVDNKEVVLKTVSGISRRLKYTDESFNDNSIFVEPIVSAEDIFIALEKNDKKIHELTDLINELKSKRGIKKYIEPSIQEKTLIDDRKKLTTESLLKVFSLYNFYTIDSKIINLLDICKNKLPPTGTGDCCAVKLLNYAYKNKLIPISMDEIYYGKSTSSKINGISYPPCDNRCKLILPQMMGLEILYQDEHIVVVNKQSGLLSVPGRGIEKSDCVVNRLKKIYPNCINQPSVHRLDMETSGLLVLGLTELSHKVLSKQFEQGFVNKEYIALLDGLVENANGMSAPQNNKISGEMELYFRVDLDNRPHQIWDSVYGKKAITKWKQLSTQYYTNPLGKTKKVSRILFTPLTGRTHQLRLAAADIHGLNMPIIGDTLYGTCLEGERLMLHAHYLSFYHPITNKKMEFTCESEF